MGTPGGQQKTDLVAADINKDLQLLKDVVWSAADQRSAVDSGVELLLLMRAGNVPASQLTVHDGRCRGTVVGQGPSLHRI